MKQDIAAGPQPAWRRCRTAVRSGSPRRHGHLEDAQGRDGRIQLYRCPLPWVYEHMDTPQGPRTTTASAHPRDEAHRLRTEARLSACMAAALDDGDPALVALIRGIIARTCGDSGGGKREFGWAGTPGKPFTYGWVMGLIFHCFYISSAGFCVFRAQKRRL